MAKQNASSQSIDEQEPDRERNGHGAFQNVLSSYYSR